MLLLNSDVSTILIGVGHAFGFPQSAIDDIIHGWNGLFHHTVQLLNGRVREKLALSNVDINSIDLKEVFTHFPSPFEGLESQFLQKSTSMKI